MKTGRVVPIYPRVTVTNAKYLQQLKKRMTRVFGRDLTDAEVVDRLITFARKTASVTTIAKGKNVAKA